MQIRIAGVAVGLLIAGGIGLAAVRSYSSPEKELTAACARFHEAFKTKDSQAVSTLLAPDFEEVRLDGAVRKRPEAEANYQRLMQDWLSFEKNTFEIDSVKIKGPQAVIQGNKLVSGTMADSAGAFGAKGKTHKVVSDTLEENIWLRTPQGWKLKNRHIVLARITVDGKEIEGQNKVHIDHTHEAE